ncbi:hypothetical protein [Methylobacterium sp. A54F]
MPFDLVMHLIRAEPDTLADILENMPEVSRARLAVWLYGRSHTHEIGIRVAATCEGASLRRTAGLVGNALYELSRQPSMPLRQRSHRVSLGGTHGSGHLPL